MPWLSVSRQHFLKGRTYPFCIRTTLFGLLRKQQLRFHADRNSIPMLFFLSSQDQCGHEYLAQFTKLGAQTSTLWACLGGKMDIDLKNIVNFKVFGLRRKKNGLQLVKYLEVDV